MKLIVRPKPNAKYFDLGPKEATVLAWQLAKDYSLDGRADMQVFREFTGEWAVRRKKKGQLSLV